MLTGTIVFIAPLLFFDTLYSNVFIDPILGLLAGAGFATVFLNKDRDWIYSIYIWMLCATLILVKDSGMLFALLLAIVYGISLLDRSETTTKNSFDRKKWLLAGGASLSVLLPKLLWSLELTTSEAFINFSGKVDLMKLFQVLIGRDTTYLRTVYENWGNALFAPNVPIGNTNFACSYFMLFLFIILLAYYLYRFFNRMEPKWKQIRKWVLLLMAAEIVIFIFGLCVMYMFKFSEYEAVRLASFTRYVNTVFLGAWLVIGLLAVRAIDLITSPNKKQIFAVTLLLVFLAIAPVNQLYMFVRGDFRKISIATRAKYVTISEKINAVCDGDSTIHFISQEDTGLDRWVVRFNVRPNIIAPIPYQVDWSIGNGPFYEGDIWTMAMTPEQWQDLLIQKYDYVALYRLNDYFYEHYSVLFEDPSTIMENAVYRVDKDTGLLVFCQ